MKNLLLRGREHLTLAFLITGLASLAGLCTSIAVALSPLESTAGLEHVRPQLTALVVFLGAIAAVCLALAAAGRSISSAIAANSAFLLHPRITLAALVTGLASLGGVCTSVAVALSPLETVSGLEALRPHLTALVVTLGSISAVCLALAAVGRSVSQFIDSNGQPPPTPPAVTEKLAA